MKDWLGAVSAQVELPEGATVAELLEHLTTARLSASHLSTGSLSANNSASWLRGIAVSINTEYASRAQVLLEGDEVGLLPPVSGGCASETAPGTVSAAFSIILTREPIDAETIVAAAKQDLDGAVVVFDGIVRNNTRGRQTLWLDYEAYEEMALKQMEELATEARRQFGVRQATMIHRLGRLMVGETSVLIVVASAHRAQAFDACRWLIDTLKKTVPIWKKETFADGAVWAAGEPFPAELAVEPEASHEG
jgi:molybdopterin synthase catalytic subunit/molybdopterin converting factor small subunit